MSFKNSKKAIAMMYVESNLGDILLMKEMLKRSDLPFHLTVVRDGEKAIQMLKTADPFAEHEIPDLILLDLHLPRLSGLEILATIRKMERYENLPVVIMGPTKKDRDIQAAYANQADLFLVKPTDLEHLGVVLRQIEAFCLSHYSHSKPQAKKVV